MTIIYLASGPPLIDGCALSGLHSQPLMPDRCVRPVPPRRGLRPDVGHHFFGDKGFDGVADLYVVEILNTDATFVAASGFRSIFLEALQSSDLAFEDHDV